MADQNWMQTFGSEINTGTNSATVVAGNGADNYIGGNVTAVAHQNIGGTSFGPSTFGGFEQNHGTNSASILAANGIGNHISGNVTAVADEHIGHTSYAYGCEPAPVCHPSYSCEPVSYNEGYNSATATVANGSCNYVGGDVTACATQDIGDHFHMPVYF